MTLVEHLTELRRRLVISAVAVAAGALVAFFLYEAILEVLRRPYCEVLPPGRRCALVIIDPLEGFATRLRVSGWVGLFLAAPVVLWQVWRFVTPALHPNEKRYAIPFVVSSMVLFVAGAAVGLATFPRALEFFGSVGGEGTEQFYGVAGYLRLVMLILAAFGVAFEFPVLLVFLQLARVVDSRRLRKWRRPAVLVIAVVAAVITPTQDPWSMLAMAVPMYVFYEVAILIGRLLKR